MADALESRFEVLVIEGLDRLSRDMVEQERVVRRLEHRGIRIIGVSDGYDSQGDARKIHRTMRGIINEVYLDDLRKKTHRGLTGKVAAGLHAGGMSFGYRSIVSGTGKKLEIIESQAETVRQIFTWYGIENWSVERIAHQLNELRKESPRGGAWGKSVIYGCPKKGSGILNNPLYNGTLIWNRAQWVKDPDTGARQRLERPKAEWMTQDKPELRIVKPSLWNAVYSRMHATREGKVYAHSKPTLFGGLLRCSLCQGPLTAVNQSRYGCKNAKEHGHTICRGLLVSRKRTDERLIQTVREELLSPVAIIEFQKAFKELSSTHGVEKSKLEQRSKARLAEIERETKNLVQALATIGVSDALAKRLGELENEKSTLIKVRSLDAPRPVEFSQERLQAIVAGLDEALLRDTKAAKGLLAELFGDIRVVAAEDGHYAEFTNPRAHLLLAAAGETLMVAGAGFEPTTFGL
jgi:site-specific DNA recombinase